MKLFTVPAFLKVFFASATLLSLSACGGSSGDSDPVVGSDRSTSDPGTAPLAASDTEDSLALDDESEDGLSCAADFDIADLLITESDRQWSCEILSDAGDTVGDVYFSRIGTVLFGENDIRYWNRNLPFEQFNVLSPSAGSAVISDIESFNTVLSFTLSSDVGAVQTYNCVLTTREVAL